MWRLRKAPTFSDYVSAGLATALILPGASWLYGYLVPQGCETLDGPVTYRWNCLLSGLLIAVSPVLAILMPIFLHTNRRAARPWPDGLLPTMLAAGLATQIVLIGA